MLLLRDCDGLVMECSIAVFKSTEAHKLSIKYLLASVDKGVHSVTARQKWFCKHRNLKEGDVVLVANDTTNHGSWPMGRVDKCDIDGDGLIRTVMVGLKEGVVRKGVRELCLLKEAEKL